MFFQLFHQYRRLLPVGALVSASLLLIGCSANGEISGSDELEVEAISEGVHVALALGSVGEFAPDGSPERIVRVSILNLADRVQSEHLSSRPSPGNRWWGVEVEVQNIGSSEVSTPFWKLRDFNDGEYDEAFLPGEPSLNPTQNLTPGGKTKGWIYFEIPNNVGVKWLRADSNMSVENHLYFDAGPEIRSLQGGTDRAYVFFMCKTQNELVDELFPVLVSAMEDEDENAAMREAINAMKGLLEDYRDDLRNAPVPGDVREHHDRLVSQLSTAIDNLDPDDPEALDNFDFGEDEEEFPAAIQGRLSAVAEDVEACAESDIF
jgi:hypothetical protein